MKQDLAFPVKLSYFADRKYVDISTISAAFFRAIGLDPADSSIESEAIRLFGEITSQGELRSGKPDDDVKASFRYRRAGVDHLLHYIESEQRIAERSNEAKYNWWDHIRLVGNSAEFVKPLGNVMTYNLMVMGKVLILHTKSRVPRVVSTDLSFHLRPEHYPHLQMELKDLKNDFVQLQTYVGSRPHGVVNVKLLASKEVLVWPV